MRILNHRSDIRLPTGGTGTLCVSGPSIRGGLCPWLSIGIGLHGAESDERLLLSNATGELLLAPARSENCTANDQSVALWGILGKLDDDVVQFELLFRLDSETIATLDRVVDPTFGFALTLRGDVFLTGGNPGRVRVYCEHRLRPDDWRQIAAELGLDKRRVFEIKSASFVDLEEFEDAWACLMRAQDHLRAGRYGDVVSEARKVVEAVLRDRGYGHDGGRWLHEAAVAAGLPESMGELLRQFKRVVNPEHHVPGYTWKRPDAEFVLTSAAALAQYVGHLERRT